MGVSWVKLPSHVNILGNQRADELANAGRLASPLYPPSPKACLTIHGRTDFPPKRKTQRVAAPSSSPALRRIVFDESPPMSPPLPFSGICDNPEQRLRALGLTDMDAPDFGLLSLPSHRRRSPSDPHGDADKCDTAERLQALGLVEMDDGEGYNSSASQSTRSTGATPQSRSSFDQDDSSSSSEADTLSGHTSGGWSPIHSDSSTSSGYQSFSD